MPSAHTSPKLPAEAIEVIDRPWFPYLCTEVEHWEWQSSGDNHFNFWMALGGEGYLRCEGQTFRIYPGVFFIFAPGMVIHAMHYGGPRITRFSAHFFPLRGGRRVSDAAGFPLLGGEVRSLSLARRQIDRIMRVALRRSEEALLAELLFEFIRQSTAEKPGIPEMVLSPRIAEALRLFRESPAAVGSTAAVAAQLGVSRSHFDREFRKETGLSPRRFLINCKMIEARRYLESSHLRVGEIAEALGYRDIYFFSRQFKQCVGQSPLQYRQSMR